MRGISDVVRARGSITGCEGGGTKEYSEPLEAERGKRMDSSL